MLGLWAAVVSARGSRMLLWDPPPSDVRPQGDSEDQAQSLPAPLDARPVEGVHQLGALLLAYVLLLCGLSTLAPFDFTWPPVLELDSSFVPRDALLNACMMFPVGFLYRMTVARPGLHASGDALLLGLGLSGVLESLQLCLPTRCTSLYDLGLNALGCLAGAQLYQLVAMLPQQRWADRLFLRMPLANLFYLLTLQTWVAALGVGNLGDRISLLLPLAACGALLMAALYNHRLKPAGIGSPVRVALFAAAWAWLCAAPAAFRFSGVVAAISAATMLGVWVLAERGFPTIDGRRFERKTVAWLAPLFGAYLAGLVCRPWAIGRAPFYRFALHAGLFEDSLPTPDSYDLVEYMAAFTVLGYALAQVLSRTHHASVRQASRRRLIAAAALAFIVCCALECWRGAHPLIAFRVLAPPLAGLFSAWGAAIQIAQLAVVRELLTSQVASDVGVRGVRPGCSQDDASFRV